MNARKVHRDYVNGEGFLYLGRSYRLKLVSELAEPLMLKDGYFCLRTTNGSAPDADAAFKAFYREKGAIRIPPRVAYFQAKMDVEPRAIKVLDLKHRWASCTPGGNLNFHWKCMMAPLTILDYIVVHELAHLIYPNHTAGILERSGQGDAGLPGTQGVAAAEWGGDGSLIDDVRQVVGRTHVTNSGSLAA